MGYWHYHEEKKNKESDEIFTLWSRKKDKESDEIFTLWSRKKDKENDEIFTLWSTKKDEESDEEFTLSGRKTNKESDVCIRIRLCVSQWLLMTAMTAVWCSTVITQFSTGFSRTLPATLMAKHCHVWGWSGLTCCSYHCQWPWPDSFHAHWNSWNWVLSTHRDNAAMSRWGRVRARAHTHTHTHTRLLALKRVLALT